MFEKELYNFIKSNFQVENFNLSIYFGEVPENQKAPYVVMYPLDIDGTRQVLCNNDDFTDGVSYVQFNIYALNPSNAYFLKHQFMKFLANIEIISEYRVLLNLHEGTRTFPNINNGLSAETVTREFTYTKIIGD